MHHKISMGNFRNCKELRFFFAILHGIFQKNVKINKYFEFETPIDKNTVFTFICACECRYASNGTLIYSFIALKTC